MVVSVDDRPVRRDHVFLTLIEPRVANWRERTPEVWNSLVWHEYLLPLVFKAARNRPETVMQRPNGFRFCRRLK